MVKHSEEKRKSRIVTLITRILNVRYWVDWDRLKSGTLYLSNGFKKLFVPQAKTDANSAETFKEARQEYNLSETDLIKKQKALFRLAIIMVSAALFLFFYMWYQLFFGSLKAVIVSFVVTLIALVLAFRYHFWYFQIKNRKLGCTFQEWLNEGILGAKK